MTRSCVGTSQSRYCRISLPAIGSTGRFQVEAQLLASLSHPHIASIHGFEEDEGTYFLVLELVEGEALAERISRGPLPLEEALDIGFQIADALQEAHAKKVVHLDLKPANIKITPNGKVKVLDFGIARMFNRDDASTDLFPSATARAQRHSIARTPSYMSPEQASAASVDWRSDIWAWGCVMYEMLKGSRAFADNREDDVMTKVATAEPDWAALRVPAPIHSLLRRCLEKDAGRRLQHLSHVRAEIGDEGSGMSSPKESRQYAVALAVLVVGVLLALAVVLLIALLESN